MNFKEFTNPSHVYDGYFDTYFIRPFVHHYANFRGQESAWSCALALTSWIVISLGIAGILMGLVGILGPDVGFSAIWLVGGLWVAASVVPILSLLTRASHGAPKDERHPRFLGVDTLLLVSCILFFLFGLLMMLTTINSGSLDPNAGATTEEDTVSVQLEEVYEEPIFTYQDTREEEPVAEPDSLSDMTEPDLVDQDESFDPTLVTPDEELGTEEAVSGQQGDSIQ